MNNAPSSNPPSSPEKVTDARSAYQRIIDVAKSVRSAFDPRMIADTIRGIDFKQPAGIVLGGVLAFGAVEGCHEVSSSVFDKAPPSSVAPEPPSSPKNQAVIQERVSE